MENVNWFENLEDVAEEDILDPDLYALKKEIEEKKWNVVFDDEETVVIVNRPGSPIAFRFDVDWILPRLCGEDSPQELVDYIPDMMLLEEYLRHPYLSHQPMAAKSNTTMTTLTLDHFKDPKFRKLIKLLQNECEDWEYDELLEGEYDFWEYDSEISDETEQKNLSLAEDIESSLKELGLEEVSVNMEVPGVKMWIQEDCYPIGVGIRVDFLEELLNNEYASFENYAVKSIVVMMRELHLMKSYMDTEIGGHMGKGLICIYDYLKDPDGMQAVIESINEDE